MPIRHVLLLVPIFVFGIASLPAQEQATPAKKTPAKTPSFAGTWLTSFGKLTLKVDSDAATGRYDLGTVTGTIKDRVLTLRYREPVATGDAKFTLAKDGQSFTGVWRQDGTGAWQAWNGRLLKDTPLGFAGLWDTSFGLMRLSGSDEDLKGAYDYPGGAASITGEVKNKRFVFRYKEPDAQGSGSFQLSDDGLSISGKWRADGQQNWKPWTGSRKVARSGRIWLVILEANWERSIEQREYAFGDMLSSYFTMATARHVDVRHRFFHDAKDLERFCSKIQFLAEPVVLLISTHGSPKGITVFGETITSDVMADALKSADNIKLLHLSGCDMMAGDFPNQIHRRLGKSATFPISGYKTSVAWDASALGDFTFLSLLLIRRLDPAAAVQQARLSAPFLGDRALPGAVFKPLGLSLLAAPKPKK